MAYIRCECKTGDVAHRGQAIHKRVHGRCTRVATHEVRRVWDTSGARLTDAPWYQYCELCAIAIQNYQGSDVEARVLRKGKAL